MTLSNPKSRLNLKASFLHALLGILLFSPSTTPAMRTETAGFAGGCFWCMEEAFEKIKGVLSVTSGYEGGSRKNPTYQSVSSGSTGHFETIRVVFDPEIVTYRKLLDVFWHNIDPSNPKGQFCDIGPQYRSVAFYHNEEQKRIIEESIRDLERSKPFQGPIATLVRPASDFYPAEDYHQDYYKKNPITYKFYKYTCGRAQRLEALWGDKIKRAR